MDVSEIVRKAKLFALHHRIELLQDPNVAGPDLSAIYAPFCLFPTPFPQSEMEYAKSLQRDFSSLLDRVSMDTKFLAESLANVADADDFTGNLVEILKTTSRESVKRPALILMRSDYMLESRKKTGCSLTSLQQLEFNMIAASLGGISERMPSLHRYTYSLLHGGVSADYEDKIPSNFVIHDFTKGLAVAFKEYGSPKAVIAFITEPLERNIFDIFAMELDLYENYSIRSILVPFDDIIQGGTMEAKLDDDKKLTIGTDEVAVCYFRGAFLPKHYSTRKHWEARLLLERSKSIQSPSVALHLTGTKKVQQELSKPGVLERFVDDSELIKRLRATFCRQYSLAQCCEGDEATAMALACPDQYVLKPQREGGGNNFFDDCLKRKLLEIEGTSERSGFVLVERIRPPTSKNYIIRYGEPSQTQLQEVDVVDEFGTYGAYVRNGETVCLNEFCGYMLRSKNVKSNEIGILAGLGAYNSFLLEKDT